ncbi:MAG TPA: chalcone isomerase family protein [Burkholderiales bacterium]|nr:chalcone isomerase family protein [Burkholderiales bacterium]
MRGTLLVLALLATPALADEVAGVKVDDRVRVESSDLMLNGAGLRTKYFLNIYVAALYLTEKKATPADILALRGAKRVSMRLMRGLSAKQLTDALEVGIDSNTSAPERETLKGRLDELTAIMNALQSAKKGDLIALDWLPGMGTRISLNGEPHGKPIAGEDFYRALLRIWLGEEPAQESLKKALLGGS